MKPRMVLTLLPFLFAITVPAFSQQTSFGSAAAQQSAAPQQPGQSTANSPAVAPIPSYPDAPAGLEKLISDMLKMQKDGDAKNLATYIQSLVLPNTDAGFGSVFGDKLGTGMANAYDRTRLNLPLSVFNFALAVQCPRRRLAFFAGDFDLLEGFQNRAHARQFAIFLDNPLRV